MIQNNTISKVSEISHLPSKIYLISDTSYYAVDLHEGTSYEFRVYAENRVGYSEPSKISAPVNAKDPWNVPGRPGPPGVGKMTRRSCLLTWTPPDYDGGNPIRNYVIEYRVSLKVLNLCQSGSKVKLNILEMCAS